MKHVQSESLSEYPRRSLKAFILKASAVRNFNTLISGATNEI